MSAVLVVSMMIAFAIVDAMVRLGAARYVHRRTRKARKAALGAAVRIDTHPDAPSLCRVELPGARASVLVVDDQPDALDDFRRILVLDGFAVDTVRSGPEALGLLQIRDYDFIFTDLEMPGMDGVEVVRAVRHLHPDIEVAVTTAVAAVETSVEAMKQGAVAYLQKPFSERQLTGLADELLIRRQARIERERDPAVLIVSLANADVPSGPVYRVPAGAFFSRQHAWARIEPNGRVRVGMDDFARKALCTVSAVVLPEVGRRVRRGDPLFSVKRGMHSADFPTPFTGEVTAVNVELEVDPDVVIDSPYVRGWACLIEPEKLVSELGVMMIGKPVVSWYKEEILRLRQVLDRPMPDTAVDLQLLAQEFLSPATPHPNPA